MSDVQWAKIGVKAVVEQVVIDRKVYRWYLRYGLGLYLR